MLGRGSFVESFPLFGLDLADYDVLFEEKLELFDKVRAQKPVHWEGRTRPALQRPERLPAAGSTTCCPPGSAWAAHPNPCSAVPSTATPSSSRSSAGSRASFAPLADLYREAMAKYGHPMQQVATHSPGHVAATDEQAREEFFPHWLELRNRIGAERGWGPAGRGEFDAMCAPEGALYVGSPETVAQKIVRLKQNLGVDRFDLKYSSGPLPHAAMMRSIELLGTAGGAPRGRTARQLTDRQLKE